MATTRDYKWLLRRRSSCQNLLLHTCGC